MRAPILLLAGLVAVVVLCCSGCSILHPAPDRTRFFVLTPLPGQPDDSDDARSGEGPMYGLGPIRSPAYLERREIVTRTAPTEITYSQNEYWAESPESNMSSVLLHDLEILLKTDRIVLYPWSVGAPVDFQIRVAVLRFDGDAAGEVRLAAHWSVTDSRSGHYLLSKTTELTRTASPGDTAACVAALSSALNGLSEEIAQALRALPPPQAER